MNNFIFGLIFALLMVLVTVLDKAYQHVSPKELKRQARAGDQLAKTLYKTAAYGLNVRLFLGAIAVLSAATSFVLLANSLNGWLAFIVIALLLWFDFLWLGSTRLTKFSARLGAIFSTPISHILHYLHPILERISRLAHIYYPFKAGTGLYDSSDVIELLEWQKYQPDNRVSTEKLELAKLSLTFNNKLVSDILRSPSHVRTVRADETIGPVLIDELSKSGQMLFPVSEGKNSRIIGTFSLSDVLAAAKKGGKVSDIMSPKVYYVNEDFNLNQALQAFLKTKHDLFVVVNKFEDFAGIITIQDILAQLIGQPQKDEFENYDNLKAVAAASVVEETPTEEPKTETVDEQPTIEPEAST